MVNSLCCDSPQFLTFHPIFFSLFFVNEDAISSINGLLSANSFIITFLGLVGISLNVSKMDFALFFISHFP